ncbi:hypothetical protein NLJ89_g5858 [Agrocybe chaxingu]|uniref:Cytochrome P450 n=1 Tax=Agrocybe chaxingu TaxID=84603 RepID=A0A9W8K6N3_9AGAR|nr:hypothetical protein NLJ89_g5858 [Agrocybe chaxingu]
MPWIWVFLLSAVLVAFTSFVLPRRRGPLPPGPLRWPLIGNGLDLWCKHPWKVYARWAQEYRSDILSLQIPGATIIILNKEHVVQDLFVKRGLIYSDRPYTAFFEKLGISRIFVFQDYGERWKNNRKAFKRYLGTETESVIRSNELLSCRRLLISLLTGNDHQVDFRKAVNDFFLSATYGIPPSQQDEHVALTQESAVLLKRLMIQGLVFEFLPFLASLPTWFTAAGVTRGVGVVGELVDKMMRTPFESAKADSIQGARRVSVAGRFFRFDKELSNISNDEEISIIDVLGTSYAAGTDTVVALVNSFALAMVLYPDIQRKAYTILNSTLRGRLPALKDYGTIPYIDALVQEVVRWNPIAPLGVPHVLRQDDVYKGYILPKGSICIANTWNILHDEERYGPNIDEFIPERFLNADGTLNETRAKTDVAFGFGRRTCPGESKSLSLYSMSVWLSTALRDIAREFAWILFASVLSAYELFDARDENGMPLYRSKIEYTTEIVSSAPHFKCQFRLRPGITRAMIHEAVGPVD